MAQEKPVCEKVHSLSKKGEEKHQNVPSERNRLSAPIACVQQVNAVHQVQEKSQGYRMCHGSWNPRVSYGGTFCPVAYEDR